MASQACFMAIGAGRKTMTPPPVRPPWFDPAMPTAARSVLRYMLEDLARSAPDALCLQFADGSEWSYAEAWRQARIGAAALQDLGVRKGDTSMAWLPNGPVMIRAWFGAALLGAIHVPINTSYRGGLLAHVVKDSGARVIVVHPDLQPRLDEIDRAALVHIVNDLAADPVTPDELPDVAPWDVAAIVYTSGTTGPSKGVLSPYAQIWTTGVISYGYMKPGERILVNLPLFHVGGISSVYGALAASAAAVIRDGFKGDTFWDLMRQTGCSTTAGFVGTMADFMAKAPPRPDDADNPMKMVVLTPVNQVMADFAARFGFDYITGFNMTEVSDPLMTDVNPRVWGGCGRPRTGIRCRIVDEHDIEVQAGTVGELVIRADLPWTMNVGYHNNPTATARAWRNGWFHTGDAFRMDEGGEYYFVDRLKDAIRRRGENISSFEVERELLAYPGVHDAAAVAVPGDHGEDEVMAVVSPAGIVPEALVRFLVPRLPHFMVPRYVRVLPDLPKTPTNKVRKVDFRSQGVTPDTWDREAAGIVLKGVRLN